MLLINTLSMFEDVTDGGSGSLSGSGEISHSSTCLHSWYFHLSKQSEAFERFRLFSVNLLDGHYIINVSIYVNHMMDILLNVNKTIFTTVG